MTGDTRPHSCSAYFVELVVKLSDCWCAEREAIKEWMAKSNSSPMTGAAAQGGCTAECSPSALVLDSMHGQSCIPLCMLNDFIDVKQTCWL